MRTAILACALAFEAGAAQRVFVASYGSDANSCTLAAPCRGFTRAMTQVDSGGEVVALDAAGYGVISIDKSVTIMANPGFFAGIATEAIAAISIDTPGIDVTLRGLSVTGVHLPGYPGPLHGVWIRNGASLTVENCVFSNFKQYGINAIVPARLHIVDTVARNNTIGGIVIGGGAKATLDRVQMDFNDVGVEIRQNVSTPTDVVMTDSTANGNTYGVLVGYSTVGGQARASIERSTMSHNSLYGLVVNGVGSRAAIGRSSIVGNAFGLGNSEGVLETYGDNLLRYNTTPTFGGPITPAAGQ